MRKRFCSALLAAILAVPAVMPQTPIALYAEEQTGETSSDQELLYSNTETVTVSNGSGAVVLSAEEAQKFSDLADLTFETTFTATGSSVNSLMFIGDSTKQHHYVSVYMLSNKIGIECQTANRVYAYQGDTGELSNVDFSQEHTLQVKFTSAARIEITLDGTLLKTIDGITSDFTNDVLSNINYVGFGKGVRTNNDAYQLTGTLKNIKVTGTHAVQIDPSVAIYTHDESVTVNNGTGALVLDAADQAKFARLTDMTFEAAFTATGAAGTVQSLMFIGDQSAAAHYVSIYVLGSKLGIECQNTKNGNEKYPYKTDIDLPNVDFSKEHLLAVTFEANSKMIIYLDGEKIHEAAVSKNFVRGVLTDVDYVGFGKGIRQGNNNAYPLTGTIRNIRVYGASRSEEQIRDDQLGNLNSVVYQGESVYQTQNLGGSTTDPQVISSLAALSEGSWNVRFRMDETQSQNLTYLSTLSDSTAESTFISLYVMKSSSNAWTAGIDAPNNKAIAGSVSIPAAMTVNDGFWHDLLAVREGTKWTFYLDGTKLSEASTTETGFFDKIANANTLAVGYAERTRIANRNPLSGSIAGTTFYSAPLTEQEARLAAADVQDSGLTKVNPAEVYLSDKQTVFEAGYDGSKAYRIPSMITTDKGTVLAGIDKRNDTVSDKQNIDFSLRRKEKGDTEFGQPIIISDLLKNPQSGKAALNIDSVLVQDLDENSPHKGRIHALMDMFPESDAAMGFGSLNPGDQYLHIGENAYRAVYKDGETQPYAVVEENGIGIVYTTVTANGATALGEKTEYTVTLHCPQPYTQLGNLYKNGDYAGNIFMNENGKDKGELHMKKAMFIWHFYSDDDGKTWSEPTDITPMVKENWMHFFGTGPGRGVQLDNGRLVIPVYSANSTWLPSQSSAIIVSDDWGESWTLKDSPNTTLGYNRETMNSGTIFTEAQPVQLKNGDLLLFMRTQSGKVKYAVSKDNGESWDSIVTTEIPAAYCQFSAITYTGKDGSEYVLVACPKGGDRTKGILTRGLVKENGDIEWYYDETKLLEPTGYAYSCLTEIEPAADGTKRFANFYELNNNPIVMTYVEFDENYLSASIKPIEEVAPEFTSINAVKDGNKLTVTVESDEKLFAAQSAALTLECAQEEIALPLKAQSGPAGRTSFVFEGNLPENFHGIVRLKGFSAADGELTNRNGLAPIVEEQDLIDCSVVTPAAIKDYSSQYSDSTAEGADGAAVNIIDGNPKTFWHSDYDNHKTMPQSVTFDLGSVQKIDSMNFLNRQSSDNAICKDFRLEVSTDGENFTQIVDSQFENTQSWQTAAFDAVEGRYFRFYEDSNYSNNDFATIAEITFNLAVEGVERQADKSQLEKLIADLPALKEGKTAASAEALQTVLDQAQALVENSSATQGAVDSMAAALVNASRQLAQRTVLADQIESYKDLKAADYTPQSWQAFQQVLSQATAGDGIDALASQTEVDRTIMKLHSYASRLVPAITQYTVTFKNGDAVFATLTVDEGTAASELATQVEAPQAPAGMRFAGWKKEGAANVGLEDVTADATYTAVFEEVSDDRTIFEKALAHFDFEGADQNAKLTSKTDGAQKGVLGGNTSIAASKTIPGLGNTLQFPGGTGNYMDVDNLINTGTGSSAFSLWYRHDSDLASGDTANRNHVLLQHTGSGRAILNLKPDGSLGTYLNGMDANSTGTTENGQWQNVTVVFNQTDRKVKFYINGELDSEADLGTNSVSEMLALRIGCHKNASSDDPYPFRGEIDEILVFDQEITAQDAKTIYDAKAPVIAKAALQARIDAVEAENLNEDDYTADSWKQLDDAIKASRAMIASDQATAAQVNEQLETLNAARSALAAKPAVSLDYTLIDAALQKANGLNLASFKADNQDALALAKTAAANARTAAASQKELDDAAKELNLALLRLRLIPAREAL